MNIKVQPCLQVFWPQVRSSHPITSSQVLRAGLHPPPLTHFQTHQIMIQRKRLLHLLLFFLIFPSRSSPSTSKGSKLCFAHATTGEAQCRRQRLVENHKPQAGRWPTRAHRFQQSMCLCSQRPPEEKLFFPPSTYVSAYRSMQPSSDKKNPICSEHKFIFNKTAHLFINLLHCTEVNIFTDDFSHPLNNSNQRHCVYKSICEVSVVQARAPATLSLAVGYQRNTSTVCLK